MLNRRPASERPMRSSIVRTSEIGCSRIDARESCRTVAAATIGSPAVRTTTCIGLTVQFANSGCRYGT